MDEMPLKQWMLGLTAIAGAATLAIFIMMFF